MHKQLLVGAALCGLTLGAGAVSAKPFTYDFTGATGSVPIPGNSDMLTLQADGMDLLKLQALNIEVEGNGTDDPKLVQADISVDLSVFGLGQVNAKGLGVNTGTGDANDLFNFQPSIEDVNDDEAVEIQILKAVKSLSVVLQGAGEILAFEAPKSELTAADSGDPNNYANGPGNGSAYGGTATMAQSATDSAIGAMNNTLTFVFANLEAGDNIVIGVGNSDAPSAVVLQSLSGHVVPIPAALPLLASAVGGLYWLRRRRAA